MSVHYWIAYTILLSYLVSYRYDLWSFKDQCPRHWGVFFETKLSLILSLITRTSIATGSLMSLIEAGLPTVQHGVLLGASTSIATAIAIGRTPFIFLSHQVVKARLNEKANQSDKRNIGDGIMQNILWLDRSMWKNVVREFRREAHIHLLEYNASPKNRLYTMIIFEENKEMIIRQQEGKYSRDGYPAWLHSFVLDKDDNSQRAETIVNILGIKRINKRIKQLENGTNESEPSVALRKRFADNELKIDNYKTPKNWKEWIQDPQKMQRWLIEIKANRRATSVVAEFLDVEHKKQCHKRPSKKAKGKNMDKSKSHKISCSPRDETVED